MKVKSALFILAAIALRSYAPASAQAFTAERITERISVVTSPGGGERQLVIASEKGLVVFDTFWSRITAQAYKDGIIAALGRDDFCLTVNTVERLDMFGGNAAYQNAIIGHRMIVEKYKGKEKEVGAEIQRLIELWRVKENAANERLKTAEPGSQAAINDRNWAASCKQRADELQDGFSLVLPTRLYDDREKLDLGDMTLELVWFGRAGYDGMSLAVIPEEKIAIVPGFIMHKHHLAPYPHPTYVRLDVARWIDVLEEILEGDEPCDTIICDVNSVWPRERAIAHLDYIRRLWDATAREETAGKSLDEVKKQLSLEGDFAFVKNMQVYKDGGDEWIRPQHESHVRLFYLQHKNMACDVLRDALATSPRSAVADVRKLREGGSDIYFDEASIIDLGHELLSASRNSEAIEVFRLNVDVFPGSADAHYHLAEACLKIGQKENAIEHYKNSLDLDPKNENAKNRLAELDAK